MKHVNDLLLFHANVRSLQKNIDKLANIIAELERQPDIIAISETKIKTNQIVSAIDLFDYNFVHVDSLTAAGGVGFYVKESVSFTIRTDLKLNLANVEDMWIEVGKDKPKSVIIGVVYRHPKYTINQIERFTETLCDLIHDLNLKKSQIYVLRDINLDLLQLSNNNIRKFINSLIACSIKCLIDKPTRISDHSKTLLDHIYTNNFQQNMPSGILYSDISDHLIKFTTISAKYTKSQIESNFFIRDMKNFNVEDFCTDLSSKLSNFLIVERTSIHQ